MSLLQDNLSNLKAELDIKCVELINSRAQNQDLKIEIQNLQHDAEKRVKLHEEDTKSLKNRFMEEISDYKKTNLELKNLLDNSAEQRTSLEKELNEMKSKYNSLILEKCKKNNDDEENLVNPSRNDDEEKLVNPSSKIALTCVNQSLCLDDKNLRQLEKYNANVKILLKEKERNMKKNQF